MIARLALAVWSGVHALRQVPDALVVTRPEVRRDGPGVARRGRHAAGSKRGGR